jgi:hypothetical protein
LFRAKGIRGDAAAATDIEDALARRGFGAIDQEIENLRQQHILRRLPLGPALAAGTVPVGDLVGVLFVTFCS